MTLDEPKTLGERYSTAIQATNLRVKGENEPGPADLLMAAGFCDDTLGARLYRLRAEFDSLKASMSGTGNCAATDKVLMLTALKSLEPAKEAIGQLAMLQATRLGFLLKDAVVLKVAGRVIDYFLDPNCQKCTGRRLNRGSKDAVEDVVDVDRIGHTVLCRTCAGTGKRVIRDMGSNDAQRHFFMHMLGLLEEKMGEAEAAMRRNLR